MAKRKPSQRQHVGKQPHTKAQAFAHLIALRKKDGAFGMRAYKCEVCKRWHVGHQPRRRGKR